MKGVEDALRRLDGVSTVSIDLQSNLVTLGPHPRREIALAEIPRSIVRAGFTPGAMRLRARGEVVDGGRGFRIAGWRTVLPLAREAAVSAGDALLAFDVSYGPAGVELARKP